MPDYDHWLKYDPEHLDQYLYHAAPTSERARIQTHGLYPSAPRLNPQWGNDAWVGRQPEGIYLSEEPHAWAEADQGRNQLDVWRVPRHQLDESLLQEDPIMRHPYYVYPHPIQPELMTPYEHYGIGKGRPEHWHASEDRRDRQDDKVQRDYLDELASQWEDDGGAVLDDPKPKRPKSDDTTKQSDACKGDEDDYVSVIGQPAYDEWQFSPDANTDEGQARLDALVDAHDGTQSSANPAQLLPLAPSQAHSHARDATADDTLDVSGATPIRETPAKGHVPTVHTLKSGDATPLSELMTSLGLGEWGSGMVSYASDMGVWHDSAGVWHDSAGVWHEAGDAMTQRRPSFKALLSSNSIREPGKFEPEHQNVFSTIHMPAEEDFAGEWPEGVGCRTYAEKVNELNPHLRLTYGWTRPKGEGQWGAHAWNVGPEGVVDDYYTRHPNMPFAEDQLEYLPPKNDQEENDAYYGNPPRQGNRSPDGTDGWDSSKFSGANWWKPGQFGRGLISPDQDVHLWPEEEMTHAERLNAMGVPHGDQRNWERITIMPNGSVGVFHPDQANLLTQFNPKLRPGISPYIYDKVTQKAKPNPFYIKMAKTSMYPEHLVTDGAPRKPDKFTTTEEDHEQSKKVWPLPEDPNPWPPLKLAASDPNWLKDWIGKNGPYMVHETNPGAYHKIIREGLLPHDTISSGSIYAGHLVPRANHVYLRHPGRGGMNLSHEDNTHHVVVDLRKLDPAKIAADEDAFMHQPAQMQFGLPLAWEEAVHDEDGNRLLNDDGSSTYYIRHGLQNDDIVPSWGAYADKFHLNNHAHTAHSLNSMATMAYQGGVHPSAFTSMPQAHEELRNWHPTGGDKGELWSQPSIDYTDSQGYPGLGNPEAWPNEWSPAIEVPYDAGHYFNRMVQDRKVAAIPEYYYHAAPTSERDRIMTHGLVPAEPRLNPQWNMEDFGGKPSPGVRKQPEGIYVTKDIDAIPWYTQNSDIWRIPAHTVDDVRKDKLLSGSYVIPHAVQPELHRKYEDSEEEYIKNQDREWENGLMPDDWLWDMAGQRDYGNWAPHHFNEWGIGRGTKRGLDPV